MLENVGFSKFWGNSFLIFSFKIYPINDTDFNFLKSPDYGVLEKFRVVLGECPGRAIHTGATP